MKRVHSKEEIVQAGLDVILTRGYHGTGIDAILKQANVPKGSFYNFFGSKEEFGIAALDQFAAQTGAIFQPILTDATSPPLLRIRKSLEALIARFEGDNCNKGCLIANLALELSDQSEAFRERLDEYLQRWIDTFKALVVEAQERGEVAADLDPSMLAENLVTSFEGALLRARVKKTAEPLKNFIHLYFERYLA